MSLREAVEALRVWFASKPLAGYTPDWEMGYRCARDYVREIFGNRILSAPEPSREELREWQGEYICSVCHKEFGRPLGIAMIFYRSEHYLIGGGQCPGKLIPHERRKGGKV